MGRTSVRTVLEHPDFIRIIQGINERAEAYEKVLIRHQATMLLAAQAAQTFRNKQVRHYGLGGMYCSNQKHVASVPV